LNVNRGYDNAGRLTSVQDWLSNTTTFGYDVNSNLTTETLPSASGIVDTFTFDAADRLTAISDKKGKTTLFSATYGRDNANQLTSDSSISSSTGSYKYNSLNELCYAGSSTSNVCTSPPRNAIAYKYDAADNMTQMGGTQQAFNNADELCWTASTSGSCASPPTGATSYTYDSRGNRTKVTPPSGGATNLIYDQANRLTAYGTTATYTYNGDGLRMSKTVSGSTSQFLWDVGSVPALLIKDGLIGYLFGPGNMPLEQINGSTALWLHHDQLGSTRLVTSTSGASQATYTYDSYGNLTASTGTITNPIRFSGQYFDGESGNYYLRTRYYDPKTAQFLSQDRALPLQPYDYVKDNPLNSTDATGLCPWCVGAVVGGILGGGLEAIHQLNTGDHHLHLGGILVATGVGAITGATGVGLTGKLVEAGYTLAQAGFLSGGIVGGVAGFGGSVVTQQVETHHIDLRQAGVTAGIGAVFGALGGSLFGEIGPSAYGRISASLGAAAAGKWGPVFSSPIDGASSLYQSAINDQIQSNLETNASGAFCKH
jgi:RHS repeat-associated protein